MRALVIALLAISTAWGQSQLSEVVVDVEEQGQKLIDVLRKLQQEHGLNYAVSHATLEEAGLVSVSLKQVPLDVALESILSACDLNLEIRGTVLVILPRGVKPAERLPSVPTGLPKEAPPTRSYPDAPPTSPDDPPLSEAIGVTQEIDLEDKRLRIRVDGVARDFFLPAGNALLTERLKGSIMRLKPGEPIHVLYEPDGTRPVIRALIGGAYAGEETRRQAQQRPTRPVKPRKDENVVGSPSAETRAATPRSTGRNRTTAPEGGAETIEAPIVGTFVGVGGGVVKIKRADGEVFSCLMPADDADAREKCEAAFRDLEPGVRVILVCHELEGRRVIRDYIVGAK
ncbi:MAG: STN domain-containing protein [Planctomycetes bacterium]|nr:STN domain-containing protein [Planctomycetota bacterium]